MAEIVGRHRRVLARERRQERGRARPRRPDRRGARLRRQPVAARRGDEHGEHVDVVPARAQHGQRPEAAALRVDAGGGRGAARPSSSPTSPPTSAPSTPRTSTARTRGRSPPRGRSPGRLNVPAVRMLRAHGVERFAAVLRRLGVTTLTRPGDHYGLALILGGAEGTLWDVTGVYAGVARSALAHDARGRAWGLLRADRHRRGRRLAIAGAAPVAPRGELPDPAGHARGGAAGRRARPGGPSRSARKIAWKTGTSYGFRDAWAVGVTPRHAVGVWVGNADGEGRPGLTGHSAAAPILFSLFEALPAGGWFAPPRGASRTWTCAPAAGCAPPPTARAGGPSSSRAPGSTPRRAPSAASSTPTRAGEWQVHGDCEPVAAIRTVSWFVLPPALETHYRRVHADYRPPPAFRPDCRGALGASGSASLSFVYPARGAPSSTSPSRWTARSAGWCSRRPTATPRRASSGTSTTHSRERRASIHQMALAPRPGPHVLVLVDERGETVRRRFTVVGRSGRGSATLPGGPVVQLVRTAGS